MFGFSIMFASVDTKRAVTPSSKWLELCYGPQRVSPLLVEEVTGFSTRGEHQRPQEGLSIEPNCTVS